jgi:parvulin-like peptidyl-prolyl isomerase
MINERLVLQAAERAGITSPRAELDQQLEMVRASVGRPISDKEFQDGIEDQYGMSFAAFQTYLHEDMVRQKYIEQHIIQEADKAGESVSEATINDEIQNLRDEMTVQNGRALSDDEFNDLIKKQGMDMTALRGNIRRQLTARNYLIGLSGGPPSEDKIQTLYNQNKTTFVRPDTISFNLIGVPFKKEDAAGKAAARARAEELARKIGSSSLVFNEEFALAETSRHARPVKYFQLSPDNPQIQQVFGLDFIDKAMSLAENAVSGVIEGRQGFFIIKVTSKYPQEILGLDSLYRLGGSATVRDMIRAQLMQQALANGMAVATSALVEELRKEASVEINEELLLW